MTDLQRFIKNLRYACDRRSISTAQLSKLSGVNLTYIYRVLAHEAPNVSLAICGKLAKAVGLTVHDLTDEPGRFILWLDQREKRAR